MCRFLLLEATSDLTHGLAESFFVFDQGESQETFTCRAEARTGADCYVALFEQQHGEIHRA